MVMPEMELEYAVSTIDKNGHVMFATNYAPRTEAGLLKQMRTHIAYMIENSEYPTLTQMQPSLQEFSKAVTTVVEAPLAITISRDD
jgi:hypothetical protein